MNDVTRSTIGLICMTWIMDLLNSMLGEMAAVDANPLSGLAIATIPEQQVFGDDIDEGGRRQDSAEIQRSANGG